MEKDAPPKTLESVGEEKSLVAFSVGRLDDRSIIHGDRMILESKSKEFKRLIANHDFSSGEPIVISYFDADTIQLLISYLESNQKNFHATLSWKGLVELKVAAESFYVENLVKILVRKWERSLNESTIWKALEACGRCEEIRGICEQFLMRNTYRAMQQDSFLEISESVLLHLLSLEPLKATEYDLVHACVRLAKAKGDQEKHFMDVALPHLRLLTLPTSFIDKYLSDYVNAVDRQSIKRFYTYKELPDYTSEKICRTTIERQKI